MQKNDASVSEMGLTESYSQSERLSEGSIFFDQQMIAQYRETYNLANLFGVFNETLLMKSTKAFVFDIGLQQPNSVMHQIMIHHLGKIYERYPDQLILGLTKIGGLLALFKVTLLMRWYHKVEFERRLNERRADKVTTQVQLT